jgi:hypothetical protein
MVLSEGHGIPMVALLESASRNEVKLIEPMDNRQYPCQRTSRMGIC